MQPAVLVDRQDQFSPAVQFDDMDGLWWPAPIAASAVDAFLRQNNVVVVEGPIDRAATREAFLAEGFEPRGADDDYAILTAPGMGSGVAIGTRAVVGVGLAMSAVSEPRAYLDSFLDARAGRVERFVEANPAHAAFVDAIDDLHFCTTFLSEPDDVHAPENGRFRGRVAFGHGWTVAGGTLSGRWVIATESPDSVTANDLRAWVTAEPEVGDRFEGWRDFAYERSGRVGVVTARKDAADF
jgi:hypothetical protein